MATSFKNRVCLLCVAALAAMVCGPHGPAGAAEEQASKSSLRGDRAVSISYSFDSLDKLLFHTEDILADPDGFLERDPAYSSIQAWHMGSRVAFERESWLRALRAISKIPAKEREANRVFRLAEEIKNKLPTLENEAIPLLFSYLPREKKYGISADVHFSAFAVPNAINIHDVIVFNVTHPSFQGNASAAMNILVHELFHSGYGSCLPYRQEPILAYKVQYLLQTLQNEGMATYVAYKARDIFANPWDEDYPMLDDAAEVANMRKKVNNLFSRAAVLSWPNLQQRAWRVGISGRALYVVGADMARTIEKGRGREALVKTVEKGPIAFYKTYNELANEGCRLYQFNFEKNFSFAEAMKVALEKKDEEQFQKIAATLKEEAEDLDSAALEEILCLGYRLIRGSKNVDDAMKVFQLTAELFPESAFSWAYVAEAHLASGEKDLAKKYIDKALALDKHNPHAAKLAKQLGSEK